LASQGGSTSVGASSNGRKQAKANRMAAAVSDPGAAKLSNPDPIRLGSDAPPLHMFRA
jgi:hypothetical protein